MRISCFTIPHSGGPQASWSHISVFRCQTFDWLWDIWSTLDGCLNSLVALVVAFRIVKPKWGYVFLAAIQSPNSLVVLVIAFRIVKPKWGYVFWGYAIVFSRSVESIWIARCDVFWAGGWQNFWFLHNTHTIMSTFYTSFFRSFTLQFSIFFLYF